MVKNYYKLRHIYCKLQQNIIRTYGKKLLQISSKIYDGMIITNCVCIYYKLLQFSKLLQIT